MGKEGRSREAQHQEPAGYRCRVPERHKLMSWLPDHIPMISQVCRELEDADIENARLLARSAWPFDPQDATKRSMSSNQLMELWMRDGFLDRYTGQRLLYPGTLRLLGVLMPEELPYHPNGKLDECHMIHWELYPSHDHRRAAALGGSIELDNLVTCSMLTNARKGHWTLAQPDLQMHDPGRIEDWDGQTAWFVRMIEKSPSLLEKNKPLRNWHKVAQRQGFG